MPVHHLMFWHHFSINWPLSVECVSNDHQMDSKGQPFGGTKNLGIPRNGDTDSCVLLFCGHCRIDMLQCWIILLHWTPWIPRNFIQKFIQLPITVSWLATFFWLLVPLAASNSPPSACRNNFLLIVWEPPFFLLPWYIIDKVLIWRDWQPKLRKFWPRCMLSARWSKTKNFPSFSVSGLSMMKLSWRSL